jgi:hypothetical protein
MGDMKTGAPKLFISYSWTSEEHERWVIDLATQLREAGVDVILDKWDLKEGHDAYHFMEQMVSNPDVRKVVIVCDRKYAEKADHRAGGVGTETQIISPEIYAKQQQDKFVVVVSERDEQGKPYLPTFYRSRIYIDLSHDGVYAKNFEQLLRWVYDKPLYVKPPLGEKPGFLSESEQPSLGTTVFFQRALDAIRNNRSHRAGAVSEYFDRLATGLDSIRISDSGGVDMEFDDRVLNSINSFLPYRNEALEIFLALAQFGPLPDEQRATHRFFERAFPYMHRPETARSYREWDFDNFRFVVHEMFLYLAAAYMKYERFTSVAAMLQEPYYVGRESGDAGGTVSFSSFRVHMKSLDYRNKRLSLGRLSLRADLLQQRSSASGLSFQHVMQADFTLYLRDAFDTLRESHSHQHWWPETLLYASDGHGPFEIYARGQSKAYFNQIKVMFDIENKTDFEPLLEAYMKQRLYVPHWQFESVSPAALLGFDRLATKP